MGLGGRTKHNSLISACYPTGPLGTPIRSCVSLVFPITGLLVFRLRFLARISRIARIFCGPWGRPYVLAFLAYFYLQCFPYRACFSFVEYQMPCSVKAFVTYFLCLPFLSLWSKFLTLKIPVPFRSIRIQNLPETFQGSSWRLPGPSF